MPATVKANPAHVIRAKVTSKGQITIPMEIRRSLGVKPGDKLRFESQENGFRLTRDVEENVFEKWRGIGVSGIGPGPDGVRAYMRELRGYDDYDDGLA
jgi:AbrB family looped-hinge helix DNA binding protein